MKSNTGKYPAWLDVIDRFGGRSYIREYGWSSKRIDERSGIGFSS